MTPSNALDMLIVLNGPEDGAEFALSERTTRVGVGPECRVRPAFDPSIRLLHAQLSVVSDGYRVRRQPQAPPVIVDGRPAGVVRSRIMHDGGVLQVGDTLLYLHCAPDGLARRSQGVVVETDTAWAIRRTFRVLYRALRQAAYAVRPMLGPRKLALLAATGLAIGVYLWSPEVNQTVRLFVGAVRFGWRWLSGWLPL
jgi:hypothetical protein